MYNVALADDHNLVRGGLASLVNMFSNYKVLFEADNGKEFISKLERNNLPDLVLMDITMPEMDGYSTTSWLRINYPEIKVIALTVMDDEIAIIRMLKSGAKGYLLKNCKPDELKLALNAVITKGYYFNDLVTSRLINSINKIGEDQSVLKNVVNLTEREKEFLRHLCSEKTYKEIADMMCVSPRTIDSYRDNLLEKLQVKSRIGLVLFAIKNRIVEL
ncbi:two component transcriptional regulator, LuxR family [Arcticibacter svalbardensis MN12-7]|uniref:Two component transcriptional regulator, LuxR family n=1 Tax=Arcticibacter svalbardensis MN12-7 TaxID=1150600 RepID=R9GN22_9SPHI|nr:response regulator transcription factor [Arcticibacter svalbardensis]EOR93101.1 two component transcriptional regulator, LuxR family [Arcticibacter svalbardensis MN12-7]